MKSILIDINPEYEKLVPPLQENEFNELKQSIKESGQWIPIIVNQDNVLLDGHHRLKACNLLGVEPRLTTRVFKTKAEEIIFVGECNLKRRQLDPMQRIQIVKSLEPYYEERAKSRQLIGKTLGKNFPEVGRVREILGGKAGVSDRTYEKASKIIDTKDPELIALATKESIDYAYREMNKNQKKEQRQEALSKTQVNLPETIQLYNQEFQTLKIKPNSVGLIFTDPPYHEKYLYLYEDLAKQAGKVLRDGGSLVCYVGHHQVGKVINMMEKQGLDFHWPLVVLHSGPSASVFGLKVLVAYKPLLWFTKGKYQGEFVKDVVKSEFQGKELHEWAQSTAESDYYIKYMTQENEIVYDPFMGQGTFGISAAKLKRQFIGCEVNKDHYENARRLISIANKPL